MRGWGDPAPPLISCEPYRRIRELPGLNHLPEIADEHVTRVLAELTPTILRPLTADILTDYWHTGHVLTTGARFDLYDWRTRWWIRRGVAQLRTASTFYPDAAPVAAGFAVIMQHARRLPGHYRRSGVYR